MTRAAIRPGLLLLQTDPPTQAQQDKHDQAAALLGDDPVARDVADDTRTVTYLAASATTAGQVYQVRLWWHTGFGSCACDAWRWCWHLHLAVQRELAHRGGELPTRPQEEPPPSRPAAALEGFYD